MLLRNRPHRIGVAAVCGMIVVSTLAGCQPPAVAGLLARNLDPVVLTGAQVPSLATASPGSVVAFRWNGDLRAWVQVPVQVDERHVEHLTKLRNGTGTTGPTTLAYSDPNANAGADPVTTLDANDEIAFMARDTGGAAPAGTRAPTGVVGTSGLRVAVRDPLAAGDPTRGSGLGFLYLFVRSGPGLSPSAGKDYVRYDFNPVDVAGHAESSTVSSARYSTHFSARWTRDSLQIGAGPDILDRHRNLFAVGVCGRSEDTFSAGDGGFATNIDGPVRVIRSYLGANSGTYTQREHLFYKSTERVQTFLRVHEIPGILDFYDLSPAAVGMEYSSSSTAGVTVDGVPDTTGTAAPTWEAVTGGQGALISTTASQTDVVGLALGAYYRDDKTSPPTQCTGDAFEYGAAGTAIASTIPNTDPTGGTFNSLTATRWNVYVPSYEAPEVTERVENLTTPLTTAVVPFVPGT